MHAWIVQTGEPLPCDGADERPMRATALARALERDGHRVTVISSDFWHQRKRHRTGVRSTIRTSRMTEVVLLPSPGYRRHVGIRRLLDHRQLAREFRAVAPTLDRPDVMVVGFPPIEIAFEAVSLARRWSVPSVLDVKDQWPDIFWRRLPSGSRWAGRLMLRGMERQAEQAFRLAGSITSMSEPFVAWAVGRAGRSLHGADRAFPFGCEAPAEGIEGAPGGSRRIVFAGSITRSFDFGTLLEGFRRSDFVRSGGRLVFCGAGDEERSVRAFAADDGRIEFRGWLAAPALAGELSGAMAGAAPYVDRSDFALSLPNKVVEYTSFGVPILAPSIGEIASFVRRVGVGFVYPPCSASGCAAAIDAAAARGPDDAAAGRRILERHFLEHLESGAVYRDFARHLAAMASGAPARH